MRISLQSSIIHLTGICICAYALKRSKNELIYVTALVGYSLIYFILGLIVYSNPIASDKLVRFLNKSTSVIVCLYLPILNVQLLLLLNLISNLTNAIVITSLSTAIFLLVDKCWKIFLDVFIVTQSMLLLYLTFSYADENYWLKSLSILIPFNYFTIPQLASRYSVPKLDLFSITFIFQCFFLVNAFF